MGCACCKSDFPRKSRPARAEPGQPSVPVEHPAVSSSDVNLVLSQRQKDRLQGWKQLSSLGITDLFCRPPHYSTIRQGAVGDCSFLAAICVLSQSPDGAQLLKSAITQVGDGKSKVRLFSHGEFVDVEVDDWVPVGRGDKLIVAHSDGESWVTLLEKAFVKLMGGTYDVPGSNPNTDAYHITGWIPETVVLSDLPDEDAEASWQSLVAGKSVACLGTSKLEDAHSDAEWNEGVSASTGLVQDHAYSILRVIEEPMRLLYVRNSWGKQRWKKRYGVDDSVWEAITIPGYDVGAARAKDDGCFWILWTDVLRFFSHLYILRNPAHLHEVAHMPKERFDPSTNSILSGDQYCIAWNPQYRITTSANATVHVVLTRISCKHPSFITMHAWNSRASGPYRKLLSAEAVREGVYTHGQSVILKVNLEDFIVAVSQHELKKTFDFSLKVFLEVRDSVQVERLPYLAESRAAIWGKWTHGTDGGHSKLPSYSTNPTFRLTVHEREPIVIFLESISQCSLNLRLFRIDAENPGETVQSSGAYTLECCCIGPCELDVGEYGLVASTFNAGAHGDFRVDLRAVYATLEPLVSHVEHRRSCGSAAGPMIASSIGAPRYDSVRVS